MNLQTIKKLFIKEEISLPEEEFSLEIPERGHSYDNGRFLNSVEELTEEDIELSPAAARVKKHSDLPNRIAFLFFSAVFVVSCVFLVRNLISKHKAVEIYNQLEAEFFSAGFDFDITNAEAFDAEADDGVVRRLSADEGITTMATMGEIMAAVEAESDEVVVEKKEYNEELEKMRAGLASLAQINPDIYGWISVEGTRINYPIVQGEDNDYYLNHAYTGDYLPEGSIYADFRNNESITRNYNTVLYGHNITSGAMFHDVTKFAKEDYMKTKTITVYTYDGVYIYEPFAFYESRYDYNYFKTGFTGEEEFLEFAAQVQENNTSFDKELTFTGNDRLLTLSTCTNGYYTQRYALHARLVKTITD